MNGIRRVISLAFGVPVLIALAGCSGPGSLYGGSPAETPTAPPSALDTPTPIPTLPPTATAWPTETPVLPTATSRAFPIPEGPPYEGEPFTIVFMRDGELWMSEIGGRGEWQLTHEGPEWAAGDFAISPDGQYIAFVTWDQTATSPWSQNQYMKLVRIADGNMQTLTSPDDPYDEFSLAWWDARRVTFQVWPREGFSDTELQPYTIVVVDTETGERTFEPSPGAQKRSPDGRYALLGNSTGRATSEVNWLYGLETGEQWKVTGEDEETTFLSWSPDSRWMLFGLSREGEGPDTLFVVDVEARTRQVVTPENRAADDGSWSPSSQTIAYRQCDLPASSGQNCALWLTGLDSSNCRQVPVAVSNLYIEHIGWTPDGSRLVFEEELIGESLNHIWAVRLDGTDLRLIAVGRYGFQVLPLP